MMQGRHNSKNKSFSLIVPFLIGCCFITIALNVIHASVFNVEDDHQQSFLDRHIKVAESLFHNEHPVAVPKRDPNQKLASLSCEPYGGPKDASEVVFWSDIPQDADFVSPLKRTDGVEQYLLFEPDGGGWNNIRMSMETVLAMAHAMGRTLVLPPEQRMYLLSSSQQAQKNVFSFMDFFPMDAIASEHRGLSIITMDEFLQREGISGRLRDSTTGQPSFPPANRTDWNGMNLEVDHELNPWIRSVAVMPQWNPDKCLAAFPKSRDPKDIESLQYITRYALEGGVTPPDPTIFLGKPTSVDASSLDRLKEALAGRDQLCIYDTVLQEAPVVHFHGKKGIGARLLVHFYAFLFFDDWRQDLWMKRFIRDHVRYVDDIQCAAATIVQAIRERAKTPGNGDGDFDTFHIRRGDFQYKKTRVSADEIYDISKDILTEGSTVYVGTDERDKSFFAPLAKKYNLLFLDDFLHLIPGTNTNYYGMIDQLIAARGRIFFGCWFSTFTGYINRIRGYYSVKHQLPGYEDGVIDSYYYALADNKMKMREYAPVKRAFHAREFPISWRNINFGTQVLDVQTRRRSL